MPEPLPEHTALVHDWLTGMRGGEKCLEVLCELFPSAPIHTLVSLPGTVSPAIASHPIRTSFLQRFPRIESRYRHYLPFFPRAIESFDMRGFDLIVSSSHAVAKGIRPAPGALHISYVHTPMRYIWDMFDQYFSRAAVGAIRRAAIGLVARRIRRWDVRTCDRVHWFIANSKHVRERIRRHYGRDATVIHPPVDTKRFAVSRADEGYFLVVSALVPYKRIDVAVQAFNELKLPLRIVGTGPELPRLQALAGEMIRFDGWVDDIAIARAYRGCRALIFPGEEDFGIVPVEAMATGKPVIARAKGGALETVIPGLSGTLFPEPSVASLISAVRGFSPSAFDPEAIRRHAETFDREVYRIRMRAFIEDKWTQWRRRAFDAPPSDAPNAD